MYEDTTGQNTTTHHSPPLLSAHNPNTLLSIQQAQQHQQQTAAQSSHSSQQSSQTNGSHTNGTVASAQSQIVTPSAASDSPVSPPTGNSFLHNRKTWSFICCGWSRVVSLILKLQSIDVLKVIKHFVTQGPLHIPAIPAAKRTGYEDASLLRQPWGYEPPFDYNYTPGYPYSIERDRKVFYPSYPDQYAQVSSVVHGQSIAQSWCIVFVHSTIGIVNNSFRWKKSHSLLRDRRKPHRASRVLTRTLTPTA